MSLKNGLNRLGFQWTCTLSLIFPIGHFGDLPDGLNEEEALAHLRTKPDLGTAGLTDTDLVNFHLAPPRGIDEPVYDEMVQFEKVTNGPRGRRIHANLITPPLNCIRMKDLLCDLYRVEHTLPEMAPAVKLNPVFREIVMASHGLASCFSCSHPELSMQRYDDTAGMDAAWNVILPTISAVASERCLRLTCDHNVFAGQYRTESDAILAAFERAEVDKHDGRIESEGDSFTISGIPNKILFEQLKEMHEPKLIQWSDSDGKPHIKFRDEPLSFFTIIWATEGYLADREPVRNAEELRLERVNRWVDKNAESIKTRNTHLGVDVFWQNQLIAKWSKSNSRLNFNPAPDKSAGRLSGFYSQKIGPEEIRMILPAMILDVLSARSMIDPQSHRYSWLGSMSKSFADTFDQLRESGLLTGDSFST